MLECFQCLVSALAVTVQHCLTYLVRRVSSISCVLCMWADLFLAVLQSWCPADNILCATEFCIAPHFQPVWAVSTVCEHATASRNARSSLKRTDQQALCCLSTGSLSVDAVLWLLRSAQATHGLSFITISRPWRTIICLLLSGSPSSQSIATLLYVSSHCPNLCSAPCLPSTFLCGASTVL